MERQIRRVGVGMLVLISALFLQLNYLQVVRADKLANDPGNVRKATRDFNRDRGVIQTADGAVLAQSVPTPEGKFKRLRRYPEGALFGHVTGYFSFTYGTDAVEHVYHDELAGRSSQVAQVRDVLSDRTRTGNVTLSLSKRLQQVARDSLGARRGSVVALNPTNGAVLALWSYPSFDPNPLAAHDQRTVQAYWNRLNSDPSKPLLARSFRERYAPGSTFKVLTAATALEVSCNTGFAQMGLDLGGDRLAAEARDFGFGSRPPIDLNAVAVSEFPEGSSFRRNQPALAQSAIGQRDVASTPLQMALVAAGVANGGVIMKPSVMAEVSDSEGRVVRTARREPWQRAMSPSNAATLRDMMVEVVNGGTARAAAVPGVQVAAKTGTAQTTGDNSHAWLVAFAPAEAPTVAVAVIVESQPGLGDTVTGGRVAAPIAQAVMAAALQRPVNRPRSGP